MRIGNKFYRAEAGTRFAYVQEPLPIGGPWGFIAGGGAVMIDGHEVPLTLWYSTGGVIDKRRLKRLVRRSGLGKSAEGGK